MPCDSVAVVRARLEADAAAEILNSPEDVRLTAEAAHAGELLGIELVDHLVVAGAAYVSLRRRGLYKPAAATTAD